MYYAISGSDYLISDNGVGWVSNDPRKAYVGTMEALLVLAKDWRDEETYGYDYHDCVLTEWTYIEITLK